MNTKSKKISKWLSMVDDGTLCLPRFQRRRVWKPKMTVELLKTIIMEPEMPVGVFLVLDTDTTQKVFPPRRIDGSPGNEEECRSLLLDGQQRITALWQALNDEDEHCRYHVKFDDEYEVTEIRKSRIGTKADENRKPQTEFKKKQFPVHLLNSSVSEVSNWVKKLSCDQDTKNKVSGLIGRTKKALYDKMIPFFPLPSTTERKKAVEIYKRINTNAVKLSDYYLAVAQMESETKKSLYDVEEELKGRVTTIADLETDEIGELILKIFCLLEGKIPSGSAYKTLPYKDLENKKAAIFSGIEWAVEKLTDIKIWYGKQLPSVVPLRVLPALHAKIGNFRETSDTKKTINRYLWHAFLTDRYSEKANQRLKEDLDDIMQVLDKQKRWQETKIAKETTCPDSEEIRQVRWPQNTAKSILSRGILLVCCADGADTLKDGIALKRGNLMDRERHHIFPKAKLANTLGHNGNLALNCMLIPREENQNFGNEWPGDYIDKLFSDIGSELSQVDVVKRLATHCINEGIARKLVSVKEGLPQDKLEEIFDEFLSARAREVEQRIKTLLENGEL